MRRICIVGLGWLGEQLAVELKRLGYYTLGTTTSQDKVYGLKKKVDQLMVFNLTDIACNELVQFDVLIYTVPPSAAENYSSLSRAFFVKVLKANPKVQIIYTSSTSVYGNEERLVNEQSTIAPNSTSARIIAKVENIIQQLFSHYTIIRFGGLVGGKRHPVKFLSGKEGVSKPLVPINLLHREDAILAIAFLLRENAHGIYNLCSEHHPLKNLFYNTVAKQFGLSAIEFVKSDNTRDKVVTCNAIKNRGFEFKYTSPYDFSFELD